MSLHHTADPVCPLCESKLDSAHPLLGEWFRGMRAKHPSVHVAWSYRSQADQDAFKAQGKSELPWPRSAHNHELDGKPHALALDLFEITPDAPKGKWDGVFFAKLNAENKAQSLPIKWGGEWKSIGDACHFETYLHDTISV